MLCKSFRAIRARFTMVAKLATLAEPHTALSTSERFFACVSIFVLFFVLLETEGFWAKAALELLLRIVFLIVPLEREFGFKGRIALEDVTLENCLLLLLLSRAFLQ